jgi:hypothetical protein
MPKKLKVVNLTDHDIVILNEEAFIDRDIDPTVKAKIKPSGIVARVQSRTHVVDRFIYAGRSIPITQTHYGELYDLPDPQPGVVYVVSKVVAEYVKDTRDDVFITSGLLFGPGKRVIGCRSLAKLGGYEEQLD